MRRKAVLVVAAGRIEVAAYWASPHFSLHGVHAGFLARASNIVSSHHDACMAVLGPGALGHCPFHRAGWLPSDPSVPIIFDGVIQGVYGLKRRGQG
jgi:hypothetical protein